MQGWVLLELAVTIIILLVMGVVLVLAEVLLPGGIVGSIGALFLIGGVIAAFMKDPGLGLGVSLGVIIFFCISFYCWLKYLPKLPIAKDAFLKATAEDWCGTEAGNESWLGRTGVAQTVLRPAGFALIDDERVDVVSEGEMIEKGAKIKVILVEGNRIVVERLDEGGADADEPSAEETGEN